MKRLLAYMLLALLALAAMGALTGCTGFRSNSYANSERYSAGDAEFADRIENIEIDWPSGSVRVISHAADAVLLSEDAEEGMPEELRVRWWLEGSTLHVKFAASGARQSLFSSWRKDLTLTVPESLPLGKLEIRAASAEIEAGGLTADVLDVSTASGGIDVDCEADAIRLNSASGSVRLNQRARADEVSIDTASGRIDAALDCVDAAQLESASGSIRLTATTVDALSAKTASGTISCALEDVPSECTLRSTSGDVTLSLPGDADFSASIRTTSGDFESDFPLKKDGRGYSCGNGGAEIGISTTSGDVSIRQS